MVVPGYPHHIVQRGNRIKEVTSMYIAGGGTI